MKCIYETASNVIIPGYGLECPSLRSVCQVVVDQTAGCSNVVEKFFGIKLGHQIEVTLDEGEGFFSDILDTLILKMKPGSKMSHVITLLSQCEPFSTGEKLSLTVTLISFTTPQPICKLSFTECLDLACALKTKGSEFFGKSDLHLAGKFYAKALKYLIVCLSLPLSEFEKEQAFDLKSACHLNLSACQLNRGLYDSVIKNCTLVLEIQPNAIKALFRRGSAYVCVNDYENANNDIKKGLKLEPNNKSLKVLSLKLKENRKMSDEEMAKKLSCLFR
ncbi:uncharacterized protein LOC143462174 [Clavelina lepadiformis]|uniref:uncharacterized protein LOC143462174 n=1 Tax=Clavelina lepadiformis TaxID=159417 RepID=UPI004041B10F